MQAAQSALRSILPFVGAGFGGALGYTWFSDHFSGNSSPHLLPPRTVDAWKFGDAAEGIDASRAKEGDGLLRRRIGAHHSNFLLARADVSAARARPRVQFAAPDGSRRVLELEVIGSVTLRLGKKANRYSSGGAIGFTTNVDGELTGYVEHFRDCLLLGYQGVVSLVDHRGAQAEVAMDPPAGVKMERHPSATSLDRSRRELEAIKAGEPPPEDASKNKALASAPPLSLARLEEGQELTAQVVVDEKDTMFALLLVEGALWCAPVKCPKQWNRDSVLAPVVDLSWEFLEVTVE